MAQKEFGIPRETVVERLERQAESFSELRIKDIEVPICESELDEYMITYFASVLPRVRRPKVGDTLMFRGMRVKVI